MLSAPRSAGLNRRDVTVTELTGDDHVEFRRQPHVVGHVEAVPLPMRSSASASLAYGMIWVGVVSFVLRQVIQFSSLRGGNSGKAFTSTSNVPDRACSTASGCSASAAALRAISRSAFEKFDERMVTCIHPWCALIRPDRFQAHSWIGKYGGSLRTGLAAMDVRFVEPPCGLKHTSILNASQRTTGRSMPPSGPRSPYCR